MLVDDLTEILNKVLPELVQKQVSQLKWPCSEKFPVHPHYGYRQAFFQPMLGCLLYQKFTPPKAVHSI